jgi:hypothetical protein
MEQQRGSIRRRLCPPAVEHHIDGFADFVRRRRALHRLPWHIELDENHGERTQKDRQHLGTCSGNSLAREFKDSIEVLDGLDQVAAIEMGECKALLKLSAFLDVTLTA